jgi:GAF domain-containing protein
MYQPGLPTPESPWDKVAQFASAQVHGDDEITQLEHLCGTVADVLSVSGACVTSAEGAALAASPDQPTAVAELDTLQHALGSGPGLSSISTGRLVRVDDTRADGRWPAFLEAVTVAGFRAVLVVPLARPHAVEATLSVYSSGVRTWSSDDQSAVMVLCAFATASLSGSEQLREQTRVVGQLQHALDSRVLVEQAKGVLAALERIRLDEAFERMRGHARRRGIPVREVAAAVVHLGFRPPSGPDRASGAASGASAKRAAGDG